MEVLGLTGKDIGTVASRYPDVGNVVLGGGTSGSVVCLRVVVHVGGDDNYGVGNICSIPRKDHK